MFELMIDFDEIRERLVDGIFAAAGLVANAAETVIDGAENLVDELNKLGE